jgi:hypothetical protein
MTKFPGQACVSRILQTTTATVQKSVDGYVTPAPWIATPICSGGGDAVNAYGVGIIWQSTDYYGTLPLPTTTVPEPTRTTFACPPSDNKSNNGVAGLSISDKIALGVGLGLGLPSLLLAVWTGWYTRRQYLVKKEKMESSIPNVVILGVGTRSRRI